MFCSDTNVLFLCSVANKVPVFLFVVLLGEIFRGDTDTTVRFRTDICPGDGCIPIAMWLKQFIGNTRMRLFGRENSLPIVIQYIDSRNVLPVSFRVYRLLPAPVWNHSLLFRRPLGFPGSP